MNDPETTEATTVQPLLQGGADDDAAKKLTFQIMRFWFAPVDPIRLEMFRRLFGFSLLMYMVFRFQDAREWLTAYGFHPSADAYYPSVAPPMPLISEAFIPWLATFTLATTFLWTIGWRQRLMSVVVLATQIYLQQVDHVSAFTINKFYVFVAAVFACSPAPVNVFDATSGEKRRLQSAWPIRMLQLTLVIQYFTAGTSKLLHGDWHLHADTLWTHAQGLYCTDLCAWMLRTLPMWAWTVQMGAALAFELLAIPLFCIKRLRPIGMIWGLFFHAIIALTMHNLFYFSFQMVAFYVLFVDPKWLHAVECRLKQLTLWSAARRANSQEAV